MKLIRNEVRILLDRMKEHPEDFAEDKYKWRVTFNRVKSVATLPEKFMLKRAAKQVIRENAYRSVMLTLLPEEEKPQYASAINTGLLSQAALQSINKPLGNPYDDQYAAARLNQQRGVMNTGMLGIGVIDNALTDRYKNP